MIFTIQALTSIKMYTIQRNMIKFKFEKKIYIYLEYEIITLLIN